MKLDLSSSVLMNVRFLMPNNVYIGENSVVNYDCSIDGRGAPIKIGKSVDIAPEVNIWTLQHDPDSIDHKVIAKEVVIEDYVWVANRVTVLPGVTIGEGSVIAAGSVVTKDVESYSLYGGNPARKIRNLKIEKKDFKIRHRPLFYG